MTKDEIIIEVSNSPEYKKLVRRICTDNNLWEDLFQELILILLEKEETKLIELHNKGQLKWFIIKIVQNQWQSATSPFYKKYVDFTSRTNELKGIECTENNTEDNRLDIIECELSKTQFNNKSEWYENKLINAYLSSGSLRKLSAKIGISKEAIHYSVKSFRNDILIKQKLYSIFMDNQVTCIKISEDAKKIIFLNAQRNNMEPEKYIEKILTEKAKEKCQK